MTKYFIPSLVIFGVSFVGFSFLLHGQISRMMNLQAYLISDCVKLEKGERVDVSDRFRRYYIKDNYDNQLYRIYASKSAYKISDHEGCTIRLDEDGNVIAGYVDRNSH